ncbi:MAG: sulfotransferase domain-containing protein [Candidatus Marinimicrobia bacterium]|nr:sulfotransferase domain-containing protein [Candidatus Neomarinimicrobiota bacterium]
MAKSNHLKLASQPIKKAMVVSHERSGTHFLMNTLDKNFAYISRPWINFDFELGINFHSAQAVLNFFKKLHNKPILNIVKSHHHFSFFSKIIKYLVDQFHIFYIYRDPRDTMASFFRLIKHFDWDEGPRVASVGDFIRSAPRGGILRYQKEQVPDMLNRWQDHVESWYNYARINENITLIKYRELNLDFDNTVKKISAILDQPIDDPVRPGLHENVIHKGKGVVGGHKEKFTDEDYQYVKNKVSDTMQHLGLPW